jgi:hypothetical protein
VAGAGDPQIGGNSDFAGSFLPQTRIGSRRCKVDKTSDINSKTEAEKAEAEKTEAAEVEIVEVAEMRKRARERANDGAKGARMGGMGSQGSQTDFGNPENFAKPDY